MSNMEFTALQEQYANALMEIECSEQQHADAKREARNLHRSELESQAQRLRDLHRSEIDSLEQQLNDAKREARSLRISKGGRSVSKTQTLHSPVDSESLIREAALQSGVENLKTEIQLLTGEKSQEESLKSEVKTLRSENRDLRNENGNLNRKVNKLTTDNRHLRVSPGPVPRVENSPESLRIPELNPDEAPLPAEAQVSRSPSPIAEVYYKELAPKRALYIPIKAEAGHEDEDSDDSEVIARNLVLKGSLGWSSEDEVPISKWKKPSIPDQPKQETARSINRAVSVPKFPVQPGSYTHKFTTETIGTQWRDIPHRTTMSDKESDTSDVATGLGETDTALVTSKRRLTTEPFGIRPSKRSKPSPSEHR